MLIMKQNLLPLAKVKGITQHRLFCIMFVPHFTHSINCKRNNYKSSKEDHIAELVRIELIQNPAMAIVIEIQRKTLILHRGKGRHR